MNLVTGNENLLVNDVVPGQDGWFACRRLDIAHLVRRIVLIGDHLSFMILFTSLPLLFVLVSSLGFVLCVRL